MNNRSTPAVRRLAIRLQATTLAVAALVVLMAVPAHAAPMITASDEDLQFSIGDSNPKDTLITWDADGEDEAKVYRSKNGGPDSLWDSSPKGAKNFSVDPETATYLFCIKEERDVLACVEVSATIKTITPRHPGEGETKPDLDFDFIHNVDSKARGYSATVAYTTDTATIPVVRISQKQPLSFSPIAASEPKVFDDQDVEGIAFNILNGPQTSHASSFVNLEPATTYHFVISAEDKSTGFWFTEQGSFKTLRRNVSVTFDQITIWDDSDELSEGDLGFSFWVNDDNSPNGSELRQFAELSSGDSKGLAIGASLTNAPSKLDLKVVGVDDDSFDFPFPGDYCLLKLGSYSGEGDQNGCEWTTAESVFDVGPNAPAADPENFSDSFVLVGFPQGSGSDLKFKVTGSYTVGFSA